MKREDEEEDGKRIEIQAYIAQLKLRSDPTEIWGVLVYFRKVSISLNNFSFAWFGVFGSRCLQVDTFQLRQGKDQIR